MKIFGLAALLTVSLAMIGCGGTSTTTVIEKTVTQTTPASASDSSAATTAPAANDFAADDDGTSTSSASEGSIVVPAVVGKDHQLAQDTMQAAGLYNLSEEDATGQGRMLLLDRNWTVVEQDPPAGSRVNEDATITLRSKKDGE